MIAGEKRIIAVSAIDPHITGEATPCRAVGDRGKGVPPVRIPRSIATRTRRVPD